MPVPGPDTRVVELRVHGGGFGAGPRAAADLLDSADAVDVAGGRTGRFVRPADRLRRPAPGPVLQATGRSTPRLVEGFLPPGPGSVLLVLSFPCWLVNAAFWMLPRAGALLGPARWLVRLAGVLLGAQLLAVLAVLVAPERFRLAPLLVTVSLLGVCALLTAVLAMTARTGRRVDPPVPRVLRPWAGGLLAAPVLLLATFLGAGFGVVAARLRGWLLGGPLPGGAVEVELAWLFAAAGTALLGLCSAGASWRRGRGGPAAEVGLLADGPTARAWASADWQRAAAVRLVPVLAALLVLAVAVVAALRLGGGLPVGDGAVGGSVLLCLLTVALLRTVWLPANRVGAFGTLVRLAGHWPVRAHPLVPRGATDAALSRLVARAEEHLAEPSNRVVLTGEGDGSLLAALAAVRLLRAVPESERDRLGLLVAGSGMQWLYPGAFPAVLGHVELAELAAGLGERWRSLCRGTDPAGGAVSTWDRACPDGELLGTGLRPGGGHGALPPAVSAPTGALVLGGEHWLPDPAPGPVTGRRWVPGVRGHAEYVAEEEWDRAVAIAAGLRAARPVEQAALFRLPAEWASGGSARSA